MHWFPNAPWLSPALCTLAFGLANAVLLAWVLHANRRPRAAHQAQSAPGTPPADSPVRRFQAQQALDVADVLDWEFEYARTTASEAMAERHSVVNIYLLAAGVILSGLAAILSQDADAKIPASAGTVLLWLLCLIGWIYFLAIVRLRQAWHDSAKTMNRIKDFYVHHAHGFDAEALGSAFRWQTGSLPPPDKPWTVYFYSAMLIALLNSAAYAAGGLLLAPGAPLAVGWASALAQLALGVLFFALHYRLYFAFLKPAPSHPSPTQGKD